VTIEKRSILTILKQAGSKGLKAKEIAKHLGVRSRRLRDLRAILDDLESSGRIVLGRRRRYQLPEHAGYMTGRLIGYGLKVGLLVPSEGDVLPVPGESLSMANCGDLVVARLVRGSSGQKEARILRVLEKRPGHVVAQLGSDKRRRLAHVSRKRRHRSVVVDNTSIARPGDYVIVRISHWGEPYERTTGRVTEVLGGRFSPGEDFASIVTGFNLPVGFLEEVEAEIEAIGDEIPEDEWKRRRDLTDLITFTIDPADAKDFDDAISVEPLANNHVRVGVHIADVSHYVRHGSWLDYDAMMRGRSIYLVDRVIPMLPPRLSSEVAALMPRRPRLAISVIMEIDKHADVVSYEIVESVIESKARLTYEEAEELIERGAGWRSPRLTKRIADALKRANGLAHELRQRRIARGSIELETPEIDIVIDHIGKAVDLKPVARLQSHGLIEELMILANETVASHMAYLGRLFIYRIHEVPNESDMQDLSRFASAMGYRFRWARGTSPRSLQALIEKVRGKPEQYIVSMFLLRSLKKARYSERNVGHFGLGSKCYTHFTSPIRRYPDLVVHRLLKIYGLTKSSPRDPGRLAKFIRRAAEVASIREVEGDEAERASIKAKVAEYMSDHIGEEHWGIISGIQDFGFFVMLEDTLVEGLVHVSTLDDDYYSVDSTRTMLVGSRTSRTYRIGDRVLVRVDRVDRLQREVDFALIARADGVRVEPQVKVGEPQRVSSRKSRSKQTRRAHRNRPRKDREPGSLARRR